VAANNAAHLGGVLQLRYSSLDSTNSTYFNNSAHNGGLLHINAVSRASFYRDKFQKNYALNEGAIVHGIVHGMAFGTLSFDNVIIDASNTASDTHATLVFLVDGQFELLYSFLGNPLNSTRSTTLDMKQLLLRIQGTEFNAH